MNKKLITLLTASTLLSACSILDEQLSCEANIEQPQEINIPTTSITPKRPEPVRVPLNDHTYKPQMHHHQNAYYNWQAANYAYNPKHAMKQLHDYTEQMAMKLIENMKYVTDHHTIAITSFVDLDDNLNTTNIFGNQLAESLINQLQEFGLSVIDYKVTGSVVSNSHGDFSFSRNSNAVKPYPHIDYILSGTMTYGERGVLINARIVGADTKVVVSSAKSFVPHFIYASVHNKAYKDGIYLN